MTTGTVDLAHSLRDPAPPVPGNRVRAAVHARATQIHRRHRVTGAIAAVSCAALLALGTLAVVDADPSTHERVETAAAPSPLTSRGSTGDDTAQPAGPATGSAVDTPAAPTTPAEAAGETARPDVDGTAAAAGEQVDAAPVPQRAQIAVLVSEATVPADVELDAVLTGDAGTFHAHLRTPGTLTFADVPSGDYEVRWEWSSDDGTATAVGRRAVHVEPGDVSLAL